jgi:hypothetical protein
MWTLLDKTYILVLYSISEILGNNQTNIQFRSFKTIKLSTLKHGNKYHKGDTPPRGHPPPTHDHTSPTPPPHDHTSPTPPTLMITPPPHPLRAVSAHACMCVLFKLINGVACEISLDACDSPPLPPTHDFPYPSRNYIKRGKPGSFLSSTYHASPPAFFDWFFRSVACTAGEIYNGGGGGCSLSSHWLQ